MSEAVTTPMPGSRRLEHVMGMPILVDVRDEEQRRCGTAECRIAAGSVDVLAQVGVPGGHHAVERCDQLLEYDQRLVPRDILLGAAESWRRLGDDLKEKRLLTGLLLAWRADCARVLDAPRFRDDGGDIAFEARRRRQFAFKGIRPGLQRRSRR